MAVSREKQNAGALDPGYGVVEANVDQDNLDDLLDNVLDGLDSDQQPAVSAAKAGHNGQAVTDVPTATSANPRESEAPSAPLPERNVENTESAADEEFAKQLAAGMEELVQSMGGPEAAGEFQKATEQMIKQLAVEGNWSHPRRRASTVSSSSSDNPASSAGAGNFQQKVNETLNKLRSSSSQVGAELAEDPSVVDDLLAEMMQQMGDMADLDGMDGVLETMMEQLTSKEILYDPLVDFSKKYHQWLEKNKEKVSVDDYTRYNRQLDVIRQIIKEYERPSFDDGSTSDDDVKKIAELLQKMQASGQPPQEILEELSPGIELGADGQPKLGEDGTCSLM